MQVKFYCCIDTNTSWALRKKVKDVWWADEARKSEHGVPYKDRRQVLKDCRSHRITVRCKKSFSISFLRNWQISFGMRPDQDVSQKERWTAVNGEADAYIKIECRLGEDKENRFFFRFTYQKNIKRAILSVCDKFSYRNCISQLLCVINDIKM